MTAPVRGWPAILASRPEFCLLCDGDQMMQARFTAVPLIARGGLAHCLHCSPESGFEPVPIPLVPWRTDTPRSDAA